MKIKKIESNSPQTKSEEKTAGVQVKTDIKAGRRSVAVCG
jgi:hypothetical protein